jgi:hypothetical protein
VIARICLKRDGPRGVTRFVSATLETTENVVLSDGPEAHPETQMRTNERDISHLRRICSSANDCKDSRRDCGFFRGAVRRRKFMEFGAFLSLELLPLMARTCSGCDRSTTGAGWRDETWTR